MMRDRKSMPPHRPLSRKWNSLCKESTVSSPPENGGKGATFIDLSDDDDVYGGRKFSLRGRRIKRKSTGKW